MRSSSSSRWRDERAGGLLLLVVLFLSSFSLPIVFAWSVAPRLLHVVAPPPETGDPVFGAVTLIRKAGARIRVSHDPSLSPAGSAGYVVFLWVSPSGALPEGERQILLSKVSEGRSPNGVALALKEEGGMVRPYVYWSGSSRSQWYTFPLIERAPEGWILLVLSVEQGRYLGLHAGSRAPGREPDMKLLGGYDLGGVPPDVVNEADLVIGDVHGPGFRGRIGPFGIVKGESVMHDLKPFIRELLNRPREIPQQVASSEILLWSVDGEEDIGPHHLVVKAADKRTRRGAG